MIPLLRIGPSGVPAAAFFLGFQLEGAAYGNVQPLMIALLMWGVTRASGPLWIALAASLKAVPIVYVLVYVSRGEARRTAATVALTAVLVAPMLLFDLSGYSTEPGPRQMSLMSVSPLLFLTVAAIGSLVALRLGSGRFGWLAASVTAALWLPRMLTYEVSFVLVGLAEAVRRRASGSDASRKVRS